MTLAKSFCPYHSRVKYKTSFSTGAQRSEGRKNDAEMYNFWSMFDVTLALELWEKLVRHFDLWLTNNMPHASSCFILHLHPSLSVETLAAGFSTAFEMRIGLGTTV